MRTFLTGRASSVPTSTDTERQTENIDMKKRPQTTPYVKSWTSKQRFGIGGADCWMIRLVRWRRVPLIVARCVRFEDCETTTTVWDVLEAIMMVALSNTIEWLNFSDRKWRSNQTALLVWQV